MANVYPCGTALNGTYVYCCQEDKPNNNTPVSNEKVVNLALLQGIDDLASMAMRFYDKYPWQNIRALRTFITEGTREQTDPLVKRLEDSKLPKEICPELSNLYHSIMAKKDEVFILAMFEDNFDSISATDIKLILTPTNFLEIVLWAYERSNPQSRNIAYTIAKDNGQGSFVVQVDACQVALVKALKLFNGPGLASQTISTAKIGEELGRDDMVSKLLSVYPSKKENREIQAREYYLDLYDVPKNVDLPSLKEFEAALSGLGGKKVDLPCKIWLGDWFVSTPEASGSRAKLDLFYADRYVDLHAHGRIFQFMKMHGASYENAASLLYESHPEIKKINLLTLLYTNTFVEMFWMNMEDPWQDSSAAENYEVSNNSDFTAMYDSYTKKGATFGFRYNGEIYNLPWSLASKIKVSVKSQAFGVNQVVIGTFMEAANDPSRWQRYFPGKEQNIETAVKAALDPAQSIYAMAMIYDYYLSKIETTSMKDASLGFPADVYPPIQDSAEAYEFNLLNVTRFFDAFAEASRNFPTYFPFAHYSWNLDFTADYFLLIQKIMGLKDSFSSLKMNFVPSDGVEKHDWLGPKERFDDEKSLLLYLSPNSALK